MNIENVTTVKESNMSPDITALLKLFKAHPWHGVSIGEDAPEIVNVYVEIVPTDAVKYEVDKGTGHLKIDRPQKYSNQCPALYGFIPQTYCGQQVGEFCASKLGDANPGVTQGDGDPLDILVLTEKPIQHGDIFVRARPIGGLRVIDRNTADDKLIAVLHEDGVYGSWKDVSDCPPALIQRLRHYFLTYKIIPGEEPKSITVADIYGMKEAREVIARSQEDYRKEFPDVVKVWKGEK